MVQYGTVYIQYTGVLVRVHIVQYIQVHRNTLDTILFSTIFTIVVSSAILIYTSLD